MSMSQTIKKDRANARAPTMGMPDLEAGLNGMLILDR